MYIFVCIYVCMHTYIHNIYMYIFWQSQHTSRRLSCFGQLVVCGLSSPLPVFYKVGIFVCLFHYMFPIIRSFLVSCPLCGWSYSYECIYQTDYRRNGLGLLGVKKERRLMGEPGPCIARQLLVPQGHVGLRPCEPRPGPVLPVKFHWSAWHGWTAAEGT